MEPLFNRRKTVCALLALALTVACLALPAAALEDPNAACQAAVVMELTTGKVLYDKDASGRVHPASLTKVMTALVAIEALAQGEVGLSDRVTVSENAYFDIPADGSNLKFAAGEEIALEELLYCLILTSANEVPNILAEYIAGSVPLFLERMNAEAERLGCTGTHFANTHGLTNDMNYSTALDLARILGAAMSQPRFASISTMTDHVVPATNLSAERSIKNTNNLIQPSSVYYYEPCKGGKTGYTDAAGYCVMAAAQEGDMNLVTVVMGAVSVVADDGTTQVQSMTEARRLFRWAFKNFSHRVILGTANLVTEIPIALGNGVQSVVLRPETAVVALLPKEQELSLVETRIRVYAEEEGKTLTAPVSAGEVLGEAEVLLAGQSYGTVRLVANASVELDRGKYLSSEVSKTLTNRLVRYALYGLVGLFALYVLYNVLYNFLRARRKRKEKELARRRIEELRRQESPTTGLSFEELEKRHAQRRDYYSKK